MEKVFKPVPDEECLKYHGTPEKPDIKIFVSHRIDLDSETIDNPLYIPVRCGAVYDKREGVTMLGDDTGENISEKRESLCELTVMYWAWKNVKADYYGLCHYRRYLSFSKNQHYVTNPFQLVEEESINNNCISKYGFNKEEIYQEILVHHPDVILPELFDIGEINHNPNYTHLQRYKDQLGENLAQQSVDHLLNIIQDKYPNYYEEAKQYYSGKRAYFCNCFVMRKDLFDQYCQWMFDIIFEFEKTFESSKLSETQVRIPGFFSEDLMSIFFMKNKESWNIKEKQLVWFKDTSAQSALKPVFHESSVNIILSSDNYYAPYMAVLIQSIIENSSDKNNYDIIILHTDICEEARGLIQSLIKGKENFSIRFTDISSDIGTRYFDLWAHYKKYNVYRLVAPETLKYYDKAIYLDSDIVVNTDIAELFNTDIADNLIAAVPDIRYHAWNNTEGNDLQTYSTKVLKLPASHTYFNSGVLVYNLFEFRKAYTSDFLLDMCAQRHWNYIDQDVLNIVCADRTVLLPMKWNVMITADSYNTEKKAPLVMWQDYNKSHRAPYIVHYAGNFMPCRVPTVDLYWHFWKYARNTPFYELLIYRMIENNQVCWGPAAVPIPDQRSGARKFADKILPHGSRRREFAKKILPKGSLRWRFCKQLYYIFAPQYRHHP